MIFYMAEAPTHETEPSTAQLEATLQQRLALIQGAYPLPASIIAAYHPDTLSLFDTGLPK